MRILDVLTFVLFFSSCGLQVEYEKEYDIDPLLQEYLETFLNNESIKTGNYRNLDDLVMKISSLSKSSSANGKRVLGLCTTGILERTENFKKTIKKTPIITIDREYYDMYMQLYNESTSTQDKANMKAAIQVVVDHEIGHCLLNRGHDDSYTKSKKKSIMHSEVLYTRDYLSDYDYYQSELFGQNHGDVESFETSFLGSLALTQKWEN